MVNMWINTNLSYKITLGNNWIFRRNFTLKLVTNAVKRMIAKAQRLQERKRKYTVIKAICCVRCGITLLAARL